MAGTSNFSDCRLLFDSDQYLDDIKRFVRAESITWRSHNNNVCDTPNLYFALLPNGEFAPEVTSRFVRFGSSPRAVQALVLAGKVRAMLDERYHVSFSDIEASVLPAMRHRILLNFEGQAEGIRTDDVLEQILESTPKTMEQKLDVP